VGLETQIFTSGELEQNNQRKMRLFELVSSGDSILMAGAGCSASIYPDWSNFVNLLQKESKGIDPDFSPYNESGEDFLAFADRVKLCLGESRYYNFIYREFKPKTKTHEKYHEILCSLLHNNKFRAITTTNYDIILEHALASVTHNGVDNSIWIDSGIEQAKIFEFLLSLNYSEVPKRIFHIHGKYDQKGSIILSEQEYKTKYGFSIIKPTNTIYQDIQAGVVSESEFDNLLYQHGYVWTPHRKILWSLFAGRRVVFLGFSMNDPYFQKMLDYVSQDLHTNGYDAHYLILRITPESKVRAFAFAGTIKEKYGVETVFYEDDTSFKGLERFIYEMERSINSNTTLEYNPITNNSQLVAEKAANDDALTKELMKISREKNNAD
jgi:hypothetical protein